MSSALRQYLVVTANYWAFTVTDGALRMLVLLYFHSIGYGPLQLALLFVFYELFGVVTNLVGGWLGARLGLNRTMQIGTFIQIIALVMLLADPLWLTVPYVMAAQALSGIAKDLNKMSAKSSIKLLAGPGASGTLYKWVAILTGSKNALKGAGFFLGSLLFASQGFQVTVAALALLLLISFACTLIMLRDTLGKPSYKPKFREVFSTSKAVNSLAAARVFLFAARDVWFVVALPVFLQRSLGWSYTDVGAFLALWIIGYGLVQSFAPLITGIQRGHIPDGQTAMRWAFVLAILPAGIALVMSLVPTTATATMLVAGLFVFGAVFAVNSSVHSFLILHYAKQDGVSMDVGFYYMANAMGRLLGTVLSGLIFQLYGLSACLLVSTVFLLVAGGISLRLPRAETIVG